MALERAYLRNLMLSLGDQEASYDAGISSWAAPFAHSLMEYPDSSAHEQYDDMVQPNNDLVTHYEFSTHQEIVRQSVRIAYEEPRLKVNTFAGLLALTLGVPVTTQDGVLTAYRHKLIPASSTGLPSIAAQVKRDGGSQYKYTGIHADGFVLSNNGAYWQGASTLVGSGTRVVAADAFPAFFDENWLLWGDGYLWILDTGGTPAVPGTPITIPATPVQLATNLGGGAVELGTRTRGFTLNWNNNLEADLGYKMGGGRVRKQFYPTRRTATVTIQFEIDSATEATEIAYYLSQKQMAMELQISAGNLIAAGGAFRYGLTIILPRVQFMAPTFSQAGQLENISFEANVMDDKSNPACIAYAYNSVAAYLV